MWSSKCLIVRTESQKEICISSYLEHNDVHIRHARSWGDESIRTRRHSIYPHDRSRAVQSEYNWFSYQLIIWVLCPFSKSRRWWWISFLSSLFCETKGIFSIRPCKKSYRDRDEASIYHCRVRSKISPAHVVFCSCARHFILTVPRSI